MSLKNHPNFHACKFVTDIMSSYYESLRGKADVLNAPSIRDEVREFLITVESKVEKSTTSIVKKGKKS